MSVFVVKLIMKAVGHRIAMNSGGARCISSMSLTATSKLVHDILDRSSELAYTELDFPQSFVDMAHPEDYKDAPEPVEPEVFYTQTQRPSSLQITPESIFSSTVQSVQFNDVYMRHRTLWRFLFQSDRNEFSHKSKENFAE